MNVVLRTKHSGLYRQRKGLGLHKVGYRERNLHIQIAKLAFHAKESPIWTRDEVFYLVDPMAHANVALNFNVFLEKTKLKDDSSNYTDWVRNLRIILIAAQKNYVLNAPLGVLNLERRLWMLRNI